MRRLLAVLLLAGCTDAGAEADAEMAQAMRSQTEMVERGVGLAEIFGDCTSDCSGHRAGYLWAIDNPGVFEDDCPATSESFQHGCQMGARAGAWH